MIPEPSKRPFYYPAPMEAAEFFCDPARDPFKTPYTHGYKVLAANGYVAIRFGNYKAGPDAYGEAPFRFLKRFWTLPWDDFDREPSEWRSMDDSRGTIYGRGELLPLWTPNDKGGFSFTRDKLVCTAGGPLVPLALLQLLARLPRAEVRMCHNYFRDPLFVRFKGGQAIVAPRFPDPIKNNVDIAFQLFKPKPGPLLPGGLV